jgi:hypothetical protein
MTTIMPAPKKNLDSPHKIISVTLLATGQLILATENRMYQLMNGIWEPMIFAADPVDEPIPDPVPDPVLTPTPEPHS